MVYNVVMTSQFHRLTVRLDSGQYDWLRKLAYEMKVSLNEILRQIIEDYRKGKDGE
jgi:hypothetical protein